MTQEKIIVESKKAIDEFRPYIQRDGGDIEFVTYEDGYVYVRLTGACVGCAFSEITLKQGVEQLIVEKVPEVLGVINVNQM